MPLKYLNAAHGPHAEQWESPRRRQDKVLNDWLCKLCVHGTQPTVNARSSKACKLCHTKKGRAYLAHHVGDSPDSRAAVERRKKGKGRGRDAGQSQNTKDNRAEARHPNTKGRGKYGSDARKIAALEAENKRFKKELR